MKRLLWFGVVMLFATPASVMAQSAFDGTWEMDLSKAKFSTKPDVFVLQNGMWHCNACVPPRNIKADGKDHKSGSDHPCLGILNIKVIDSRTVLFTHKKNSRITNTQ